MFEIPFASLCDANIWVILVEIHLNRLRAGDTVVLLHDGYRLLHGNLKAVYVLNNDH